jgi:ribonuclease-3
MYGGLASAYPKTLASLPYPLKVGFMSEGAIGSTDLEPTLAPVAVDPLEACQDTLGYRFKQPELLRGALTHASGADTRLSSNERLEFLGDAVLGLVVCERIFHLFPEYMEGELTKIKSVVVSRQTCADISKQLRLERFVIMGKGMSGHPHVPQSIFADLFESVIGAIFLDGGLEPAKAFILAHLGAEIDQTAESTHRGNYKSMLQQVAQREFGATPIYLLLDEKGPDHSKCFKVAAQIARQLYPGAWGRNKKEAEQKAALNALSQINGEDIPYPSD